VGATVYRQGQISNARYCSAIKFFSIIAGWWLDRHPEQFRDASIQSMVHHLIHFSRPLYFYEPFHWNYNHGKKSVVLFIIFYAWKESLKS
jgi:hypothetical protein